MPSWWRSSPKSSLPQAVERGAVELGRAADEVVDLRLERLPVRVVPGVRRDVAVVDEDVLREPVLRLAREPVAALEQQDALARGREVPGERAAAGAGADDDDVVLARAHVSSFSRSARMIRAAASISARCENACGKLPRCRAGLGVELLGVEPERRGDPQQPLHQVARPLLLADDRQRGDEPERADEERPLLAGQAVVGLVGAVAQDEPVLGQLVGDRQDGRAQALVVSRAGSRRSPPGASRRRARRSRSAGAGRPCR